MMQNAEAAIRVQVDASNPGQFFACCGLLEIADRLWGGAEGWFSGAVFCLAPGGTLRELLGALIQEQAVEITKLANGLIVKPLIAPLRLTIGGIGLFHMTLDAWMIVQKVRGEVVAAANPPWNFWSGQQTSHRIWAALRDALLKQIAALEGAPDLEDLFSRRVPLTGRFGFDPGAAWSALDAGFSPDTQQIPVATSPATELLAAVGLQRFRPQLSEDRATFEYATWGQPLASAVASAAASGSIAVSPTVGFRGKVVGRGSYGALGYSTLLKGANNG